MPYVFVEWHHECYGGATFEFRGSAVTSLVGTKACKDYCYGSVGTYTLTNGAVAITTNTATFCGGPRMFNLYGLSTTADFPTTGGPVVTSTAL
jgi:iron transport multicopper oxidase